MASDDAPVQCAEKWNKALDKYDPPNSAVVWIVWLIGQLTVSVLLLTLSGFHFGLVKPDLCDSTMLPKPVTT